MTTSEAVLDYLKKNPDFFEQNKTTLNNLGFAGSGNSDPFIARQIEVLRRRESEQSAKLNLIVDGAKHNQKLEDDFLEFSIRLVGERLVGDEAFKLVDTLLTKQFNIKSCVFVMDNDDMQVRHDSFHEIRQRVAHKSSVCDDRVAQSLCEKLFVDEAADVESVAFIPLLVNKEISGVLVLGSTDADRFAPDVGVNFLDKLGLLIGSYLAAGRAT